MANVCLYKIKVQGPKTNCYKLVNMMPLYSGEKEYISEEGTDEEFTLVFYGDCKWSVDAYTDHTMEVTPFTPEAVENIQDGDHWNMPLEKKAIALGVEIWCNSKDIDDAGWSTYEHYDKNGHYINDECPKELHIKRGRDYDWGYEESAPTTTNPTMNLAAAIATPMYKVRFVNGGTYNYQGLDATYKRADYEVGDLVMVDTPAKAGVIGQVMAKEDTGGAYLAPIIKKVGHCSTFNPEDIEAWWKFLKPKERTALMERLNIEKKTKAGFANHWFEKWVEYGQKEDDWNKFFKEIKLL